MDNKASDEAAVAASQANVREHDYSATTSSPNAIVKPACRVPCVPSATVSRTSAKVTASPSPAVTSLLASKRFNSILSRLVRDNHDRIIIKQNKEGGERPTYVQISVRNKKTPQPTPQEPTSDGVERPIPTTKSHINIIEVPPNIESSMLNQTDVPSTIKIVPVQVQRSVVSILKDPICNSESVTEQPKRTQSVVIEKEPPKLHNKISVKEVIRRKKEDLVARMYPNPDMIQSDLQSALNLAHFLPVSPPNLCSTGKESGTQKLDVKEIKTEDALTKIGASPEEPNIKVSIKMKQENIKTSAKSRLNRETDKDIGIKQEPIDPPKMKTKKPAFPLKVKLKERKKSISQKAKSNACTNPKTTLKQGSKKPTVQHVKQEASVPDYEDEKEIGNLEIVEKPLAKRKSIPTAKAKSAKNALKQTSPRPKSDVKVKTSNALAVQGKPNQKKRKRQKTLSKTKSVTSMMKEDSSPEITSTKKRPKGNNSPDDHPSSTEPILDNPDITETSLDSSGPLITITGFSESMEATPDEILDHLESIDIKEESNSNEEQPSLNKNTTTVELEDSEPEPAKASDNDLTTNASDNGPTTNASDNGPTIRFEIISNSNHEQNPLNPSTEIHVITTVKDSNASGDEPRARTSLIKSEPTTPVSTPTKHLGAEGGAARLQLCARTSLLRRIFAERGEGSQSHVMIPLPKQELSAEEEQEAQIDMKALDEKIKRMIDREVEEVEGPAAGEGGERVRAVRFKHRERERQRRKSVPNSPSSAHPPRKPRSHSASDTAVGLAPQNATATPDAEEEKTPRRTQHVEEFPAVASSSYESAGDVVAQSQSHPSLPERPRSPEPARRSQSQPAIGSRAGAKVTIEAKLAQAYSHMLAAWSDYIHMDAEQMRQAEIQNATYFQYTDESLEMIKDEDLYVWQLVEDLAKPYSIATL